VKTLEYRVVVSEGEDLVLSVVVVWLPWNMILPAEMKHSRTSKTENPELNISCILLLPF